MRNDLIIIKEWCKKHLLKPVIVGLILTGGVSCADSDNSNHTTGNNQHSSHNRKHNEEDDGIVDFVLINEPNQELYVGQKFTFTAWVSGTAKNKEVSWQTISPAVASIDQAGVVTALAKGTTFIYCYSVADSRKQAYATVTVYEPINSTNWPMDSISYCLGYENAPRLPMAEGHDPSATVVKAVCYISVKGFDPENYKEKLIQNGFVYKNNIYQIDKIFVRVNSQTDTYQIIVSASELIVD